MMEKRFVTHYNDLYTKNQNDKTFKTIFNSHDELITIYVLKCLVALDVMRPNPARKLSFG